MNREIKFRAWYEGEIITDDILIYMDGSCCEIDGKPIEREDIILLQYTGLKDKNGEEIYEGDVVKKLRGVGYKSTVYPSFVEGSKRKPTEEIDVVWWAGSSWRSLQDSADPNYIHEHEIIGNIYENPDLLNEN